VKVYGETEVRLHSVLNSVIGGGEFSFIENIPLCLISYNKNKLYTVALRKTIHLVFLNLMATCSGQMTVGKTETCRHENKKN
jgi:hypothetical protein